MQVATSNLVAIAAARLMKNHKRSRGPLWEARHIPNGDTHDVSTLFAIYIFSLHFL